MIAVTHTMSPGASPDIYPASEHHLPLDEKIDRESRALEEFLHLTYCLANTPASEKYHDVTKLKLVYVFLHYTRLPDDILSTCGPYAYSLFCSFFNWHPMTQIQVSSGPLTGEQTIHSFIQMAVYASLTISNLGWRYLRRLLARAILEPVMFMKGGEDVFNDGLISRAMDYGLMVFDPNDPECGAIAKRVTTAFEQDRKDWEIGVLALDEHVAKLRDSGHPGEWEKFVAALMDPVDATQIKSDDDSPSPLPLFHGRANPGEYPLTPVSPNGTIQESATTPPIALGFSPLALQSSPTLGESSIMPDEFSIESLHLDEAPELVMGQPVEDAFEEYFAAITQLYSE